MLLFSVQSLLCILSFIYSAVAVPATEPPFEQHLVPAQQSVLQSTSSPFLFTKICNGLIQTIWRDHKSSATSKTAKSRGACPSAIQSRYGDDVVLRFKIKTEREALAFAEATDLLYLDVWVATQDWADVRISRKVLPSFLTLLPESMQQSHTPVITSLSQAVFETFPPPRRVEHGRHHASVNSMPHDLFFENYQPLSVIYPWLRLIASEYPGRTQLFTIGQSYEGRDIPALRIGLVPEHDDPSKNEPRQTIVITAGSHAREWISVSTSAYILRTLVHDYDSNHNDLTYKLLKHFDFVFIPVLNPDGYDYTWTTDRLWRKTRQQTTLPFCPGIDIDRSFPFGWDADVQTDNPCSESYAGEHPLQAIEAHHLAEWAKNETANGQRKFTAFIDLHSYSQQILYPYSYTCDRQPHNLEDLEEIAFGLAKAFRTTSGHYYHVDSACEGTVTLTTPSSNKDKDSRERTEQVRTKVEENGGSALDYFYSEIQVKYAFQIKLRDTGSYGFLLPRENIVPTGMETFGAIMGLGRWLLGNRGIEGATGLSQDAIWGVDEVVSDAGESVDEIDVDFEEDEGPWWRRRR